MYQPLGRVQSSQSTGSIATSMEVDELEVDELDEDSEVEARNDRARGFLANDVLNVSHAQNQAPAASNVNTFVKSQSRRKLKSWADMLVWVGESKEHVNALIQLGRKLEAESKKA